MVAFNTFFLFCAIIVCTSLVTVNVSAAYWERAHDIHPRSTNEILSKCTDGMNEFTECVKLKTIEFIDRLIINQQPIQLTNFLYLTDKQKATLPDNSTTSSTTAREDDNTNVTEAKLNEVLRRKIRMLATSKNLQIKFNSIADDVNDDDMVEGRKMKDKGKKKKGDSGGMMSGAGGAMIMQMMMTKLAFLAGKALVLAKIALLLAALMLMKKMMNPEDEKESHSHMMWKEVEPPMMMPSSSGGWHRSMDDMEEITAHHGHKLAYSTHVMREPIMLKHGPAPPPPQSWNNNNNNGGGGGYK